MQALSENAGIKGAKNTHCQRICSPSTSSDCNCNFQLQLNDTTEFSHSSLSDCEIEVCKRDTSMEKDSTPPSVKWRLVLSSSPKLKPVSVRLTRHILDFSTEKSPSKSEAQGGVSEEIPLDLTASRAFLTSADIVDIPIVGSSQPGVHGEGMEDIPNDNDTEIHSPWQ